MLTTIEKRRLTLWALRPSLQSAGFDDAAIRRIMFLRWLYMYGKVSG